MEWTPDNTKSLRTWRGNYEINQRFLNRAADEIERLEKKIADYEKHCSAEKNCVAGKINMRERSI